MKPVKLSENLSSKTLFHFTRTIENLIGILEGGFKPNYCLEKTEYLADEELSGFEMAYPMVCFCDIPLSKIKKHIGDYGNYGIGLDKNWGNRKNFSPVIYTSKNAKTSVNYENLIHWYRRNYNNIETKESKFINNIISDFLMFTKPYYGEFNINGKKKNKRFYDEREWRWIPKISRKNVFLHLNKEYYFDEKKRKEANNIVAKHYSLGFSAHDVKYLVIDSEDEIDIILRKIEHLKNVYSANDRRMLASRIITKEQILYDF